MSPVICPLIDDEIDICHCCENVDIIDHFIKLPLLEKYKKKPDWEKICKECHWRDVMGNHGN